MVSKLLNCVGIIKIMAKQLILFFLKTYVLDLNS